MIRRILPALFASLIWCAPASAKPGDEGEPDDHQLESVSGRRLPKADLSRRPTGSKDVMTAEQWAKYKERVYDNIVYMGAEWLSLEPAYVNEMRAGMKLVYLRDYKGTRKHFEKLDEANSGVAAMSSVVDALVWQALMLENFDFRYNKQYTVASKQALADLDVALKKPGQEGWEHFLSAGMMGIEAIHGVRHNHYLSALQRAFEAMEHIAKAKEAAPDFRDLLLADGMYNYWRTVITMSSSMLPDFGDHRAEGIVQMLDVESGAVLLSEPATLSLAFSYLEERDYKRALSACMRNKRAYPDNVINNQLSGQTYLLMRNFDQALANFDKIIEVSPENNRVHYWKGVTFLRSGKSPLAQAEFERYLASDHLEESQLAAVYYRLGQAHFRQKHYDQAEANYKASVKVNGYKAAKSALARMKEMKKRGKL
jgi:tetratricopeptide (TPR) repeat protein